MNEARQAQPFWLWAYVFMPEHIHLIVYPLPLSVPGVEAMEEASEVGRETVDEGRVPGVESGRPAGGGLNTANNGPTRLHPRHTASTQVCNISTIVHAIKQPVGHKAIAYLKAHAPQWLPRITRRRGKRTERLFWQSGGGYDRNITDPNTLRSMIEYIHNNPVRRGLVAKATDWKWSSARWFADGTSSELNPDPIQPGWLAQ